MSLHDFSLRAAPGVSALSDAALRSVPPLLPPREAARGYGAAQGSCALDALRCEINIGPADVPARFALPLAHAGAMAGAPTPGSVEDLIPLLPIEGTLHELRGKFERRKLDGIVGASLARETAERQLESAQRVERLLGMKNQQDRDAIVESHVRRLLDHVKALAALSFKPIAPASVIALAYRDALRSPQNVTSTMLSQMEVAVVRSSELKKLLAHCQDAGFVGRHFKDLQNARSILDPLIEVSEKAVMFCQRSIHFAEANTPGYRDAVLQSLSRWMTRTVLRDGGAERARHGLFSPDRPTALS